jgi:hypothetical protein
MTASIRTDFSLEEKRSSRSKVTRGLCTGFVLKVAGHSNEERSFCPLASPRRQTYRHDWVVNLHLREWSIQERMKQPTFPAFTLQETRRVTSGCR